MLRPDNTIHISTVAIWEISIKAALDRLKISFPLEEDVATLIENGAETLPVTFAHAFAVRYLPQHHRDPFDRMLIAQAQCESLTIVSSDPAFRAYQVGLLDASV